MKKEILSYETYFQSAIHKFSKGLTWSLVGSISFELSNIVHNAFLFFFFGSQHYGLLGSLFSIIYLIITIVNFGFESSIAPFLQIVTQNKRTCRRVLVPYLLAQAALLTIGSSIFFLFYQTILHHHNQPFPFLFFFIIILSEGLRIFLRRFLHNVFLNKPTVLVEQAFAILYYAAVWLPLLFGKPLSIPLVFIPYFFNSLLVTAIFISMIISFYKKLPTNDLDLPKNFFRRLIKTRYYNTLINIETLIVSGNFIVPFFATTFGLRQAGLFKFASIVAHSIKAIVKSVVHFPGSALLASLKTKSEQIKKRAFYILADKLNQIIIFVITLIAINFSVLPKLYPAASGLQSAWSYAFIFIGTTLLHQFFIVYEQFYIIEEAANKLFIIKSIEFTLFYILVIANKHITPITTLINICLIQAICLTILAIHAYARWGIMPYFKVRLRFLAISILFSTSVFLLLQALTK